jgi:hypothetical protein
LFAWCILLLGLFCNHLHPFCNRWDPTQIDEFTLPDQCESPLSMTMSCREFGKISLRKLLARDGGGIRRVISIEILARIESEPRENSGNPKLVLADYFDCVPGTITGARHPASILPSSHE